MRQIKGVYGKCGTATWCWSICGYLIAFLSLLLAGALLSNGAAAQGLADTGAMPEIGARKIFVLLFLMIGPIKILVPFVAMTAGADPAFRHRLAARGTLFAVAALALAGVFGRNIMANFNVSVPVLALAGGLVLFLVALQTVLQQTTGAGQTQLQFDGRRGMQLALNPLAFPTIVTPYGIAALIVFATLAGDDHVQELTIATIVLAILALDWLAMIFAQQIIRLFGTALQIFAVVLGIAQVAIGLQVIFQSLRLLGVLAAGA